MSIPEATAQAKQRLAEGESTQAVFYYLMCYGFSPSRAKYTVKKASGCIQ